MSDRCKTCRAKIVWKKTANDKMMPLDAEPCDDGNIVLVNDVAAYLTKEQMAPGVVEGLKFKSHFATCPQSKQHRRKP